MGNEVSRECTQHPVLKWLFPGVVLALVGSVYSLFMYLDIIPKLERLQLYEGDVSFHDRNPHLPPASKAEIVGVATTFHILVFLFLLSFFRAVFTPPGTIPNTKKWHEGRFPDIHDIDKLLIKHLVSEAARLILTLDLIRYLRRHPLVERKKDKAGNVAEIRRCRTCKLYKPDRAHHCATCEQCVLRMDHHCPWIANCVGYANHKFFLLLLFYANLCCLFILAVLVPRVIRIFQPIQDPTYFLSSDLPVIAVVLACMALIGVLGSFLGFHVWLVANSMTTIEYKEKYNPKDNEVRTSERFSLARIKHNYTPYSNLLHVLGPVYTWLLPIAPPDLLRDPDTGEISSDPDPEPGCYYLSPRSYPIKPSPNLNEVIRVEEPREKEEEVKMTVS